MAGCSTTTSHNIIIFWRTVQLPERTCWKHRPTGPSSSPGDWRGRSPELCPIQRQPYHGCRYFTCNWTQSRNDELLSLEDGPKSDAIELNSHWKTLYRHQTPPSKVPGRLYRLGVHVKGCNLPSKLPRWCSGYHVPPNARDSCVSFELLQTKTKPKGTELVCGHAR